MSLIRQSDYTKDYPTGSGYPCAIVVPLSAAADSITFSVNNTDTTVYLNGNRGSSANYGTLTFTNTGSTTLLGGVAGTPANNTLYVGGITVNPGAGAVTVGDASASPTAKVDLFAPTTSFTNNSAALLTIANTLRSWGTSGNTTFTFSGTVTIPATITLNMTTSGTYRSTLQSSGGTNTWTGPVNEDPIRARDIHAVALGAIGRLLTGPATVAALGPCVSFCAPRSFRRIHPNDCICSTRKS